MQKQQEKPKKLWHHFVSGLSGSFVSVTLCHSLEVGRTRLNLQVIFEQLIQSFDLQNSTKSQNKYNGIIDALRKIYREEGFHGYYKGYSATIVSVPLFYSLFFSIYEKFKNYYSTRHNIHGFYNNLYSSICTGAICDLITNPLWLVRTRMQTEYLHDQHSTKYTSLLQAFRLIVREEGFFAIYKGLGVSLFGLSHVAVQFPTYEKLKEIFQKDKNHLTSIEVLKASVLSKLFACLITYPHVVLRTRLHDNRQNYSFDSSQNKLRLVQIIQELIKQDGVKGFYHGLRADLFRVLPANAITFIIYEYISNYLNQQF